MTDDAERPGDDDSGAQTIPPFSSAAPWPPLRGRFEVLAEIGRGGQSRVYRARDMVAERAGLGNPFVALKVIVADRHVDPDIIALMHREARRLRDLIHPNIVRVYDMDIDGDMHFMVLEYLEGQSLAKALRQSDGHRLGVARVVRLVADIAAALAYSHARNIIHADLKPGNVFIESSGRVKLIDFNIAYPVARPMKLQEEDTVEILGRLGAITPLYASPQRLDGAEPSAGDDVFSLGVLVYVSLCGQRPFGGHDARTAMAMGLQAPMPPGLSAGRWRALRRALTFDDRYRTASVARFAQEFTGPFTGRLRQFFRR